MLFLGFECVEQVFFVVFGAAVGDVGVGVFGEGVVRVVRGEIV